ncbi:hypothetical protein [Flindersiella endophytica]
MNAKPPAISPGLLATLLEAVPARVRRRIEAEPELAAGWKWTAADDGWQVDTGSETVTLAGAELSEAAQLSCTCLLAPRCAHLLAVAHQLELADAEPDAAEPDAKDTKPDQPTAGPKVTAVEPVELSPRQRRSATEAWHAGAGLLASGAHGGDALRLAAVLRAAHGARRAKLHRLAITATRVATQLRARSADDPGFGLHRYADDLAELLLLSHRLETAAGHADPELIGVARRAYAPIAPRRLYGICTESVHTASGYAGVVTHLADADGGLWSVSNVAPIPGGYRELAGLGGLAVGHHELGRLCVAAQGLSASADGRLSLGGGSTALRGPASDWTLDPLAGLWSRPLADQLDHVSRMNETTLVFLTATVLGLCDDGLALSVDGGTLLATVPVDNARWVANLRRLAGHPGMEVHLVCRADPSRPPYVTPLACAQTEQLRMPARWAGRVNLGLDQLAGRSDPTLVPSPLADDEHDPLAGLRRILHRVVLGGRTVVAGSRTLAREAGALRNRQLGTAADLLEELADAARETRTTSLDERVPVPPDRFARGWLAAMTYDRTVRTHLAKSRWPVGRSRHE